MCATPRRFRRRSVLDEERSEASIADRARRQTRMFCLARPRVARRSAPAMIVRQPELAPYQGMRRTLHVVQARWARRAMLQRGDQRPSPTSPCRGARRGCARDSKVAAVGDRRAPGWSERDEAPLTSGRICHEVVHGVCHRCRHRRDRLHKGAHKRPRRTRPALHSKRRLRHRGERHHAFRQSECGERRLEDGGRVCERVRGGGSRGALARTCVERAGHAGMEARRSPERAGRCEQSPSPPRSRRS